MAKKNYITIRGFEIRNAIKAGVMTHNISLESMSTNIIIRIIIFIIFMTTWQEHGNDQVRYLPDCIVRNNLLHDGYIYELTNELGGQESLAMVCRMPLFIIMKFMQWVMVFIIRILPILMVI